MGVPGDIVIFPGQTLENRDYPGKTGTDGHLKFGACWQHSGKVKTALFGNGILTNLILFLLSAEKLMHYNRLKAENKIN